MLSLRSGCRVIFRCLVLLAALSDAWVSADWVTNCGSGADPDKIDDIPEAFTSPESTSIFNVQWVPPDHSKSYFYELECADCPIKFVNTTSKFYRFENLTPATAYNVSIRAGSFGCQFSNPYNDVGITHLSSLQEPVHITDVTETSFRASWAASPDVGVTYDCEVSCNATITGASFVCQGLQSGTVFSVRVKATKDGFPASHVIHGTSRTKLFAIDASSAQYSTNATAITVSWSASRTAGVSYVLTCSGGSGGDISVPTNGTTATCNSLESGQSYSVKVTVKKSGGFESVVTELGSHLTKPILSTDSTNFAINVSVTEAAVLLTVNWTANAAKGADVMLITVASDLNADLNVSSRASFTAHTLLISEPLFFSENLTVTVLALAEKSNLSQRSQESFITTLPTPPNRPSVLLTPDKRSINVTLTRTTGSQILHAKTNETAMECRPEANGSCYVIFLYLEPFTNYTVEAWAQFGTLPSLLTLVTTRTLEDAPSQLTSVSVNVTSPGNVRVEWQQPKPNGIITNYTVHWGMLDFTNGAELSGQNVSTGETHIELQNLFSGHEYYWNVSACTVAGCSTPSHVTLLLEDAETEVLSLFGATVYNTSVHIDWQPLHHSNGVVFEYVVQLIQEPQAQCVTAQLVNCTNCRRSRDNLTSDGRSRLDSLTHSCSDVGADNIFDLKDSEVSVRFSVESATYSSYLLRPWTLYTVKVWPVNRLGPGPSNSSNFRTQETQSGRVRNLRANAESQETAMVEFEEPERKNGLLLAYAIQLFDQTPGNAPCSQLVVLNVTSESCQLDSCSTIRLMNELARECGNRVTHLTVDSGLMKAKIEQLRPQTEYTMRVTPLSQTLLGESSEQKFSIGDGGGSNSNQLVIIVVSVVVSVVILAIVALAAAIWFRRRNSRNSSTNGTTGLDSPTPNYVELTPPTVSRPDKQQNGTEPPRKPKPPQKPPPQQPPPPPQSPETNGAPLSKFVAYATDQLADAGSKSDKQYDAMRTLALAQTSNLAREAGQAEGRKAKNRYVNILPFDANRVKLSGEDDYVNASFVTDINNAGQTTGAAAFIACQGPKPTSVSDHWRMVWEQSVLVTVMLTACIEKGKAKCEQYWPDEVGGSLAFSSGGVGLSVVLMNLENCGAYIVRRMRLTVTSGTDGEDTEGESASLDTIHLQYLEWDDHAVPNLDDLAEFLSRVRSSYGGDGLIAVHCSAGVGRTGTFIALDMLVRQLQAGGNDSDVFISVSDTVLHLRRCRVDMVQTKHQYSFIYRFLLNYLKKHKRLTSNSANSEKPEEPVYVTAGRVNGAFNS